MKDTNNKAQKRPKAFSPSDDDSAVYMAVLHPRSSGAVSLFGSEGVGVGVVDCLRKISNSAEARRHWDALKKLFAVDGGASGLVTWSLDHHLKEIGIRNAGADQIRQLAAEFEQLTQMQVAVYTSDCQQRHLFQMFETVACDILRENHYVLDRMRLTLTPLLKEIGGIGRPVTLEQAPDEGSIE